MAPDLPGHGGSTHAPTDVSSVIEEVCNLTSSFAQPVPLIGYSQGGRLGVIAALRCGASVERLILVSGNAGIEREQLRRNRVTQDDARAARIELIGIERFIDEWTADGLTSTEGLDPTQRERDRQLRLLNTAGGLAAALRGYGQGVQPAVWSELHTLAMPVLVMAGAEDALYVDIGRRMAEQIAGAELVVVPGAGHNPLVDKPDEAVEAISAFLDDDRRS